MTSRSSGNRYLSIIAVLLLSTRSGSPSTRSCADGGSPSRSSSPRTRHRDPGQRQRRTQLRRQHQDQRDATGARFRQMMLSLPRVHRRQAGAAHHVVPYPDGFTSPRDNRLVARRRRLPDASRNRRTSRPRSRQLDTLRLSFTQTSDGPVQGKHGDVCSALHAPVRVHLETGQHVVIGSRTGEATRSRPIGVQAKEHAAVPGGHRRRPDLHRSAARHLQGAIARRTWRSYVPPPRASPRGLPDVSPTLEVRFGRPVRE